MEYCNAYFVVDFFNQGKEDCKLRLLLCNKNARFSLRPSPLILTAAGDHVKFGFPMAHAATMLAWGGITWDGGYQLAQQTEYMTECISWTADYFMAAHTDKYELVGQVCSTCISVNVSNSNSSHKIEIHFFRNMPIEHKQEM